MGTSFHLGDEVGPVRLGGVDLPGVVQSLEVDGNVRMQENGVPSRSGRFKQPLGFEDGVVTIRLLLLDNEEGRTEEAQIRQMESLYKHVDGRARPKVVRLVNAHTLARGISKVVWRELRTRQESVAGGTEVTVVLAQYRPPIIKKEKAASWKKKFGAQVASGAAGVLGDIGGLLQTAGSAVVSAAEYVGETDEHGQHPLETAFYAATADYWNGASEKAVQDAVAEHEEETRRAEAKKSEARQEAMSNWQASEEDRVRAGGIL